MARRVSVEEIEPGMVLAEPLSRPGGGILLGKGFQLTEAYINKLRLMDVVEVVVEGEDVDDLDSLLQKVERAVTTDDEISARIIERTSRRFSRTRGNKIMHGIMVVAQKVLIEREKKRLRGSE